MRRFIETWFAPYMWSAWFILIIKLIVFFACIHAFSILAARIETCYIPN